MAYLNLLYFLVITYYGYTFLRSNERSIKSPFDKDQLLILTGPEAFLILTFSTGLLAFSLTIGLDLMAIRLLVLEVFCIMGIQRTEGKLIWSSALRVYVLYMIWLFIGCFYGPSWNYGIRVILKYIYPLLLCLFAAKATTNFAVAMKAALMARWVALIALVVAFIPISGVRALFPGVFWYGTAQAINYISIMTLSIALFFFTNEKRKNAVYAVLFLIPCFLWVFRTSIMGSGIAIMAFSIIRWRIRSLPVIVAVLISGVIAVFTIPSLRNKMFYDDTVTIEQFQNGQISEDNLNTNGRSIMKEEIERRFYIGHEIAGSGTGTEQHFMYNNSHLFNGIKIVHNDFVQMKCDNGLIALWLYCSIAILIFLHCFRVYWNTNSEQVQFLAITAGASMLGVFATLYSDNTVNYSMATLSMPFGFYGMMLGLSKQQQECQDIDV